MTAEEYSAIQRIIGKLQGLALSMRDDVSACQLAELAKLDEIIEGLRLDAEGEWVTKYF